MNKRIVQVKYKLPSGYADDKLFEVDPNLSVTEACEVAKKAVLVFMPSAMDLIATCRSVYPAPLNGN